MKHTISEILPKLRATSKTFHNLSQRDKDKFKRDYQFLTSNKESVILDVTWREVTRILANKKELDYVKKINAMHELSLGIGVFSPDKYKKLDYNKRESTMRIKRLKEGNQISDKLPQRIDEFLQDVAQFTEDGISYSQIMDFSEIFNSKDVSILDRFRKECERADEDELQDIQDEVVAYIIKRLNQVRESTKNNILLHRIKKLEEQVGIKNS